MSKKVVRILLIVTTIFTGLALTSCGSKNDTGPSVSGITSQRWPKVIKNESDIVVDGDVSFEKNRAVELKDDFSNIDDVRDHLNTFTIKAKLKNALAENATLVCSKIIGGDELVKSEISAGSLSKAINIIVGTNEVGANIVCRVIYQEKEI